MKPQALYLSALMAAPASLLLAQSQKPNVIILTADDLGWNDMSADISCLGNASKNQQTPHLDKLFGESMVFTSAYTQQNSAPTRAALLTGLYANHNGVYNVFSLKRYSKKDEANITILPANQIGESIDVGLTTFAEHFAKAGYKTFHFGKRHGWKVGDMKEDHGFQNDFSCQNSRYTAQEKKGKWQFENPAFDAYAQPYTKEYVEANLIPIANSNQPLELVGKAKHFTDAMGDCVVDQIKKEADSDSPFCFWVCFHAVHTPIIGREDLVTKYDERTELDPRHSHSKYAALTEGLDQNIGRMMKALEDPNGDGDTSDSIVDNTIIIFTSDNGGTLFNKRSNAPLRSGKGTLFEGGTRVPMAVRYPHHIQAGSTCDESVHVIDFLPTLAELTQLPLDHKVDGESLAPILTGKTDQLQRDAIYWHFPGYMDSRGEPATVINKEIGDKKYKLRYTYVPRNAELYCLTEDIGEEKDLLVENPSEENKKIAQNLLDDMRAWLKETKPLPMYYKGTKDEVLLPESI